MKFGKFLGEWDEEYQFRKNYLTFVIVLKKLFEICDNFGKIKKKFAVTQKNGDTFAQ